MYIGKNVNDKKKRKLIQMHDFKTIIIFTLQPAYYVTQSVKTTISKTELKI